MGRKYALIALGLLLAACGSPPTPSQTSLATSTGRAMAFGAPAAGVDMQAVAKTIFGAEKLPSPHPSASFGSYAKGCVSGAEQLPETGPTWQAMRLSRNRNWGHPVMIDYLKDLSQKAARLPGWQGIYVGDISQPRGGPMLTGHASHQMGLDADIWMLPTTRLNLSAAERESISSISLRRSAGAYTNDSWTPQHHELLKAAASDPRVARIFVFPGAKVKMCNDEKGDRSWLRKIRPWYGHHYHFHVRLTCPAGVAGCVNQDPPPAGDGCDDAQAWVNNILNPPPPDPNAPKPKPKREIRIADLPGQCAAILSPR
jgi:penicillin-insensitive murein endopeptidase